MNRVNLVGRLTRDPELRYTTGSNPLAICSFSIAVDRFVKGERKADFIRITVLGKQAENCEKFLSKGRLVGIDGSIQTGSYEKDGQTHYTWAVLADRTEFLEPASKSTTQEPAASEYEGYAYLDEEIPF